VLQASGNKLTRVALKEIGKMTQLTRLDIGNNNLETEDLQEIAGLKELRRLILANLPQVKDDAMKAVAGLEKLEELDLAGTGLGDRGVAHLAPLKNLNEIDL